MVNRREIMKIMLATSLVAPTSRIANAQSAIEQIDVGNVAIYGISPDASMLVGVQERERMVFLDAATMEVVSTSEPVIELALLQEQSVGWNPAGTHVAFSLDAWRLIRDSDIFLTDAATGEITNLTPEGHDDEAPSLLDNPDLLLDVFPAWMDDETLVFGRHQILEDSISSDLVTLNLSDDKPEPWLDLASHELRFVSSPIRHLSDGKLVTVLDDYNGRGSLILADQDQNVSFIEMPFETFPELLDANDTHCLVLDRTVPGGLWLVPYDDAEAVSINDAFELDATTPSRSLPIFGTESESILFTAANLTVSNESMVMVRDETGVRELGTLPDGEVIIRSYWAESTAILVGSSGTWKADTA